MKKLIYYYSGMNAGKSAHLLQKAHNLESKGVPVNRFTHYMDTRWGAGVIVSRIGIEAQADVFDGNTNFLDSRIENGNWVFIDEAQFLKKEQVRQIVELVDRNNVTVLCYGLRTDFLGEPFEGTTYLMAWADEIREIESHDAKGNKATFNIRLDNKGNRVISGNQMEIGTHYESVSRRSFFSNRGV